MFFRLNPATLDYTHPWLILGKNILYHGQSPSVTRFCPFPSHRDSMCVQCIYTSSTRTRRGGSCLKDIYKTFLVYRTCMRLAPAKPVRARTLRNWCRVAHANTMSTITVDLTTKVKTKFTSSNAEKTKWIHLTDVGNFHTPFWDELHSIRISCNPSRLQHISPKLDRSIHKDALGRRAT